MLSLYPFMSSGFYCDLWFHLKLGVHGVSQATWPVNTSTIQSVVVMYDTAAPYKYRTGHTVGLHVYVIYRPLTN